MTPLRSVDRLYETSPLHGDLLCVSQDNCNVQYQFYRLPDNTSSTRGFVTACSLVTSYALRHGESELCGLRNLNPGQALP